MHGVAILLIFNDLHSQQLQLVQMLMSTLIVPFWVLLICTFLPVSIWLPIYLSYLESI